LKQGRLEEAADLFIRAIKRGRRGDRDAYLGLAKALALRGQLKEADEVLKEVRAMYPSHQGISSAEPTPP